jgi:hypothetical protein
MDTTINLPATVPHPIALLQPAISVPTAHSVFVLDPDFPAIEPHPRPTRIFPNSPPLSASHLRQASVLIMSAHSPYPNFSPATISLQPLLMPSLLLPLPLTLQLRYPLAVHSSLDNALSTTCWTFIASPTLMLPTHQRSLSPAPSSRLLPPAPGQFRLP